MIFLLAMLARFFIINYLGQEQETYEYEDIAVNLVTENGFSMEFFPYTKVQETCMMAPIYCFFLAFFF
ncbi:MAG: hypothetical protein ACFFAN_04190 [Promethearchaeota archaeon]